MRRLIEDEERLGWLDLTRRYRFIYGEPLQQRLARERADIFAWHRLGRRGANGPTLAVADVGPTRQCDRRRDEEICPGGGGATLTEAAPEGECP